MIREIRSTFFQRFLQRRLGTGKRFTSDYVKYFERAHAVSLAGVRDWNALDPTRRMWFDYALSTNVRGNALVDVLELGGPMRGRRYLDIGCGFGGCLVAAARRGADCTGIELDALRIAFARANLADFRLPVPVHELDALVPDLAERLGKFDFISCNDVVEHVENPEQLLRNVAALLNPGGIAYLEIPNRYSIDFVAADGHFGLFGIALLERADARAYHWHHFQHDYDVGDYAPLEEYQRLFHGCGMRVVLIESLWHPTRPFAELDQQLAALDAARARFDPGNERIARCVKPAYEEYRRQLAIDRAELPIEAFRSKYLRNFWTFVGTPDQAVGGGEQRILERFRRGGDELDARHR